TKSSEHTTPDRAFLIAWDNVSPVNVFLLFIKIHFKKDPKLPMTYHRLYRLTLCVLIAAYL
ncbi:hypothetical protein, partial [Pseudomonas aeruginosa]|uniref:hypothetical protein n=1 Tax=Pseudomonas aeruginosa TaxID=287 RepID=UPI0031B6EFC7